MNFFDAVRQTVNTLVQQNLGVFDGMGQNLFRAFATIILVWYGIKAALAAGEQKRRRPPSAAGHRPYLASMPELRGQLDEICNAGQILNAEPASVPRESVLGFIGSLTLCAQTNTLQLSAFLKSMRDALLLKGPEVNEIVKRTIQASDAGKDFLAHPPADTTTFNAAAKSLIQRFTDLGDATGKVGADLKIFANEFSEKLERESSWNGNLITILYFLGLTLTVVTGLYGIEAPKPE